MIALEEYEKIFLDFVQNKKIDIKKIPEQKIQTPDFYVTTNKQNFIAEVTAIKTEKKFISGKVYSRTPGKTLRKKINNKSKQIKTAIGTYNLPTALVVYDLRTLSVTMPEDMNALFGDLTLIMGKTTGKIHDEFFGQNSVLQPNINTSFSAFIIARWINKNSIQMTAYHNPYAKIPFPKDFFKETFEIEEMYFDTSF